MVKLLGTKNRTLLPLLALFLAMSWGAGSFVDVSSKSRVFQQFANVQPEEYCGQVERAVIACPKTQQADCWCSLQGRRAPTPDLFAMVAEFESPTRFKSPSPLIRRLPHLEPQELQALFKPLPFTPPPRVA